MNNFVYGESRNTVATQEHIVYANGITSFAEGNLVLCPILNDVCGKPQNDVDRTRSNDVFANAKNDVVPLCGHKHNKKAALVYDKAVFCWWRRRESNPCPDFDPLGLSGCRMF